jgi:hypothetical protein
MYFLFMSFHVRRTCTFITAMFAFKWFISYVSANMNSDMTTMFGTIITLNTSKHITDIIISLNKFARFTMVYNCV